MADPPTGVGIKKMSVEKSDGVGVCEVRVDPSEEGSSPPPPPIGFPGATQPVSQLIPDESIHFPQIVGFPVQKSRGYSVIFRGAPILGNFPK